MTTTPSQKDWMTQFRIQSFSDLDFVIGQNVGWPIGMTRGSPPEFKRRILAAAVSYQLSLSSIDYTLKRHIASDQYETDDPSIGESISTFIKDSVLIAKDELKKLHAPGDVDLGRFGAELTLFKVPHVIDLARMVSNRGLLLEVLPILRLCLEMTAWSAAVFSMKDEEKVKLQKAQASINSIKSTYETAGQIYGHLSKFSHWDFSVHVNFLSLSEDRIGITIASSLHRAMSLALCLLVLDVLVEIVRFLYPQECEPLVTRIQGVSARSEKRHIHRLIREIVQFSPSSEFTQIQRLLR